MDGHEEDIFLVPSGPIIIPMNAIFIPLIVLATFIVNILVCLVLLKPQMRSTTNTILTTMAIADTMTGLSPLPCYLHFYTAGHYKDWVSFEWCYAYFCLMDFLPSIFHTTSIWLTVALAVQRYISVCHTNVARWLCNSRNASIVACCLFIVATLSHIGRFIEMEYIPYNVESRINNPKYDSRYHTYHNTFSDSYEQNGMVLINNDETNYIKENLKLYHEFHVSTTKKFLVSSTKLFHKLHSPTTNASAPLAPMTTNSTLIPMITACKYNIIERLRPIQHTYYTIYYFYRIFFIHFIPCITLIIINGMLLRTMREGQSRRTRLLKMNRLSESRRVAEINRTTLMLVVVVALFLIVEFPSCMLFLILVIKNSFNFPQLISERSAESATIIVNLCILLSYPMNFFIYCAMSTQFREGFVQLFTNKLYDGNVTGGSNVAGAVSVGGGGGGGAFFNKVLRAKKKENNDSLDDGCSPGKRSLSVKHVELIYKHEEENGVGVNVIKVIKEINNGYDDKNINSCNKNGDNTVKLTNKALKDDNIRNVEATGDNSKDECFNCDKSSGENVAITCYNENRICNSNSDNICSKNSIDNIAINKNIINRSLSNDNFNTT